MPINILMPALSPTMEKGNLAKWVKKEGEAVKAGDVIAEIETDKATMEVEAADEGTLGKILVPEGTADVAVNTPIALILADGEAASVLKRVDVGAEERAAESAPPAEAKDYEVPISPGPAPSAPPTPAILPDTDVPAGTEMATITVSVSSGRSVRRSITSASMFSLASSSAAFSA